MIRTLGVFIAALLLSLVASYLAAIPLAIEFRAREEFIGVMIALNLFAIVTIIILAIVFAVSGQVRPIDVAAGAVAAATVLIVGGLVIASVVSDRTKPMPMDELQIATEFLLPALLIVVIQWWLVRRRRLKMLTTE